MILRHLKILCTDIALLQETHLPKSDFNRMKKLWVGEVVGSPAVGRRAGVLILLRKGLQIKVISTERDNVGRRISILLEDGGVSMRVTNIYAPTFPSTAYFQELSSWLGQQTQRHHYIAGDFNCTVLDLEDRTK